MILKIEKNIRSNYNGFMFLLNYYNKIKNCNDEEITLDFEQVKEFDTNLFSVISAILTKEKQYGKKFLLRKMPHHLLVTFEKNKFPEVSENIDVDNNNEIGYKIFNAYELLAFSDYIEKDVLMKKQLPLMSKKVKNLMRDCFCEVFGNVEKHTNENKVHCCGLVDEEHHRLEFTIVNMGQTIRENVLEYFENNGQKNTEHCISWSMFLGHTTKLDKSGGFGLHWLEEFLKLNKGKLQMVSDNEYLERDYSEINRATYNKEKVFSNSFNGTIVNIEVNINDTGAYKLKSEINEDDIF